MVYNSRAHMTERLACLNVCNNIRVNNELCYIFSLCEDQNVGPISLGGYLPTSTGWSNTISDMQYCTAECSMALVLVSVLRFGSVLGLQK